MSTLRKIWALRAYWLTPLLAIILMLLLIDLFGGAEEVPFMYIHR